MEKKNYWIVWNENRSEGFITDDENDAKTAMTGKPNRSRGYPCSSSVGLAFYEAYEDDKLKKQKVSL